MDLSTITIADFKARFYRDFSFQVVATSAIPCFPDPEFVQDQDIQTAFDEAMGLLNQALFGSDRDIKIGYLLLSAHQLCLNINMANGGIGGGPSLPASSRSVGNVSESYIVPDAYKENPLFATYITTAYGLKYLTMIMPYLTGNMAGIFGGTNP